MPGVQLLWRIPCTQEFKGSEQAPWLESLSDRLASGLPPRPVADSDPIPVGFSALS